MIHNKFRYLLTLVALFAMTAGAWAQEEVLLTTVTATGHTSYSQSPDGIVTVTLNNINSYHYTYGWLGGGSVTVEAPQGYTITRCVFRQNPNSFPNRVLVDDQAPFTATIVPNLDGGTDVSAATSHGDAIGDDFMNGISSIEVYGAAAPSGPEVTWNATTKQATFAMPAYDVELIPEYYPGMLTLGSGAIEGGKLEVEGLGLGTTSFTVPSEWNHNITSLTSGHFEGFKSVTEEEAKAWPGVPATGLVALFYNYDETEQKWDMIYFKDGAFFDIYKGYKQQLTSIYNLSKSNFSVFYTTGMQMPAGFEKDEEGNIYVEPGTVIKVKAVPNEGYSLVSLTDGTNDIKVDADGIATITMPDEYADLTLTATFADKFTVALNAEGLSDEEAAAWKAATGDNDPAALPLENVKYGTEVKVTYTGTRKVIGVKAEKKAATPATPAETTVTWNSENISFLQLYEPSAPFTMMGIKLSTSSMSNTADWRNIGIPTNDGLYFEVTTTGGYTFTAPSGKKFTKIEMTVTNANGWTQALFQNTLGTGWPSGEDAVSVVEDTKKVTWTGTAASTVGLLTDASFFNASPVTSIVFTLADAE